MARLAAMLALALALLFGSGPARAVNPDEVLDDPALEARARAISKELRCLVCQNQSIDDSDAGLARDLRLLVRERLEAGDEDGEVVAYLRERYGDFILLRPPFNLATFALWAAPALLLLAAGLAVRGYMRARIGVEAPAPAPLSDAERRRLAELIDD